MKWGEILPKHKCASKLRGGGVEVMLTLEIIASFSVISILCLAPDFLFSWLSSKYCSSWRARASCSDSALVTVRSSWADSESLHPAEKKTTHFQTLKFKPASTLSCFSRSQTHLSLLSSCIFLCASCTCRFLSSISSFSSLTWVL